MKLDSILENIVHTFNGIRLGGSRKDPRLAALDRGVLTVALMVAALDGAILPKEVEAFHALARKCRGYTAKTARALCDEACAKAGRLLAMAQMGIHTPKERIAAFTEMAAQVLPTGFEIGSTLDVRRAFALWVTMGASDGTFSDIERKAVEALHELFSNLCFSRTLAAEEMALSLAPGYHTTCVPSITARERQQLLEDDFIDRAAALVRDFGSAAKRPAAEAALEALIARSTR